MLHTSERERLKHLIVMFNSKSDLFINTDLGHELSSLLYKANPEFPDKESIRAAVLYEVRHSYVSVTLVNQCIDYFLD